ncbi:hypothetical protein Q9L58_005234 [Maublancomyces gigas]|uniref:Uncharacterized protein n=1 Tax=Discina gigas TaxID=1032678 RepID=A0ABR3GJT3_9PEZI
MASGDAAAALYLPLNDSTLTVRVIKNFPYRTTRNLILHHLDLTTMTSGELKEMAKKGMYTLKLYTKAQGTKTQNLIINMEDKDDELIFRDENQTLADCGCEHETEISFFNMQDYLAFKANPEEKW